MLPFEYDTVYQLHLRNRIVDPYQCRIIGTHKGVNLAIEIDPAYRNTPIRVHDNTSYEVERFTSLTGSPTNAIINDNGWHMYQSYENIDTGYRLTMINDKEQTVTYDAFPEERIDRAFVGWYNIIIDARRAELRLKDHLGVDHDLPVDFILGMAYADPSARVLLTTYLEYAELVSNAPQPRRN